MSRLRVEALRFQERGPLAFRLERGECVALSGASGSGKTLLLRALADLDAHEGQVFLDGTECESMDAPGWRRQVALLPSESRWWRDTVGEHFTEADPSRFEQLGFGPEVRGWTVARLSTGERQRLALARLLQSAPKVLLLDEPTANLDTDNTARIETLLADYRKSDGAAFLWVTHDSQQARRVAARGLRLQEGQLLPENRS